MKIPLLVASMVGAVALVALVTTWDEARESREELDEFALQQETLAQTAATALSVALERIVQDGQVLADDAANGRRSSPLLLQRYISVAVRPAGERPPVWIPDGHHFLLSVPVSDGRVVDLKFGARLLMEGLSHVEQTGSVVLLLQAPGARALHTLDGRLIAEPGVEAALDGSQGTIALSKAEAAALGLPARIASVGLARVSSGALGRWGVAVAASAERMRDREWRSRRRLLLGIFLASCLVLSFGGFALRRQRAQMQLAQNLAVAEAGRQRDEELARLSKAALMSTLASGVAHEISTPLAVIVGRAEQLLGRIGQDERSEKSARAIIEQAEHIHSVVRGLLALARGTPPPLQSVDSARVVEHAIGLVAHRFRQAEVQLRDATTATPPSIRCEPLLLEHALVNLLLNACDASDPGSTVVVEILRQARAVEFVVRDHGHGITEANAARALEPFFTTKPPGKGTGLGLAIANEIVKTHRGTLSIAPDSPRGTRAVIHLPLEEPLDAAA